MKKISIITLTYNQLEKATKPYIQSLYKYTNKEDFDLIIVDNNSTDGTVEYLQNLEKEYNNIHIIYNKENSGYSKGNNKGLKYFDSREGCKYIGLFNNDILFTPDWLDLSLAVFEKDNKIGLASPRIQKKCRFNSENYIKHYPKFLEKYKKLGDFSLNVTTYFCCAIMPKEVFEKVGYLDENYSPAFYEDDDYALRTFYEGYKVGYINTAFIYHNHSTSTKHMPEKEALMERNKKYFFNKHPLGEYIWQHKRSNLINDMKKYLDESLL